MCNQRSQENGNIKINDNNNFFALVCNQLKQYNFHFHLENYNMIPVLNWFDLTIGEQFVYINI